MLEYSNSVHCAYNNPLFTQSNKANPSDKFLLAAQIAAPFTKADLKILPTTVLS